jgi:hypothetical protein
MTEQEIAARPTIVCLCGSTRYGDYFRQANLERTLAGEIVLSIGCDTKSDQGLGITAEDKARLDALHLAKIDLADYVLVVSDPSGYFGDSTWREIDYAFALGKPVKFAVPTAEARWLSLADRVERAQP